MISQVSDYNRQLMYGEDVLARIMYSEDHGQERLRHMIIDTINHMLARVCSNDDICVGKGKKVCAEEIMAVDGKTARGSQDRALHMVSAWGCRNRLVLGQEATEEKSNEITAIPKLLELLELKGCIVTIDAMGCQTKIAEQIIDQGGDYVLGLKGNQSTLHEEVEEFFATASAGEFAGVGHDYAEETDKDHGRLEVRRYWVTEELSTLSDTARWSALRSIGMVERECWIKDRHILEQRLFINSIPADAKRFAHAVHGHWGVENSLDGCLDISFGEDGSRVRSGHAPRIQPSFGALLLASSSRIHRRRSTSRPAESEPVGATTSFCTC